MRVMSLSICKIKNYIRRTLILVICLSSSQVFAVQWSKTIAIAPKLVVGYFNSGTIVGQYAVNYTWTQAPTVPWTVPATGCYNVSVILATANNSWNSAGSQYLLVKLQDSTNNASYSMSWQFNYGTCGAGCYACTANYSSGCTYFGPRGVWMVKGITWPQVWLNPTDNCGGCGGGVFFQTGAVQVDYCGYSSKVSGGVCSPC